MQKSFAVFMQRAREHIILLEDVFITVTWENRQHGNQPNTNRFAYSFTLSFDESPYYLGSAVVVRVSISNTHSGHVEAFKEVWACVFG